MELKWEVVGKHREIRRARIFGGWLVAFTDIEVGSIAFVPDPNNEWID